MKYAWPFVALGLIAVGASWVIGVLHPSLPTAFIAMLVTFGVGLGICHVLGVLGDDRF